MKSILLILIGVILSSCGQKNPDVRTLGLNREGNKNFLAQTYPAANEKYLEALRFDPFIGALHLNLGLSFEGLEQAGKALQSYKEAENLALQEKNMPLVFMARFNQAQLLAKAKRVDEALDLYQKALEIIPTSLETKTNIELLTSSQGGGGGEDNQDKNDQNKDNNKDQKDGDNKDDKKDQDKPQEKQQSPKYKPRPFAGKELSEADVKKILGEIKQQEEKIRAEYNRKEVKEQPRDKDW